MPDISMCKNNKCPSFLKCYRAQTKPNPMRQAYASFDPQGEDQCKSFWDIPPSIKCPACKRVSYHSGDIEQKYCGNCNEYHERLELHETK